MWINFSIQGDNFSKHKRILKYIFPKTATAVLLAAVTYVVIVIMVIIILTL
jgi:hypothetical protein